MRKKRFSLERMVGVLKQAEVGVPVAEVIRKAGISEQTFYRWKAKYAGLEIPRATRSTKIPPCHSIELHQGRHRRFFRRHLCVEDRASGVVL
jgi:predicted DNA-binding transcriptional regulator YafY